MIYIKKIILLLVGITFFITNVNAVEPRKVAIFVNGFSNAAIENLRDNEDLRKTLRDANIESFFTSWTSVFMISGTANEGDLLTITAPNATKNFVEQMITYFGSLPEGSEVYLFGHSFGGDSILQFLDTYRGTAVKIRLVAVIDPVQFKEGGTPVSPLRPFSYTVPSNVDYFFNRWQTNTPPPFNYLESGYIPCNATYCDQKERSIARNADGSTVYVPCKWFEVTCPGYTAPIPFVREGSTGRKQQRLTHGTTNLSGLVGSDFRKITADDYIAENLIHIIKQLNALPPPKLPPKVRLCNKSSEDIFYARMKYNSVLGDWISEGWWSIDALECIIETFGENDDEPEGTVYYYAGNSSGLEWPVDNSSSDRLFCANQGIFSFSRSEFDKCTEQGNFVGRGAAVYYEPDVIKTVDISPEKLVHTLTVKSVRKNTAFGRVTSSPVGINGCAGECSADFTGGYLAGSVILTALASDGSTFAGWKGCTPLAAPNQCEVLMTKDKVVEALFTSNPVIMIERRGTGNGNVVSNSNDINCGLDCVEEYENNSFVTLRAEPASGSLFTGWFGFQANHCSDSVLCEVNVDSFYYLIAQFDKAPTDFLLDVSKDGEGSGIVFSSNPGIACGEDCSETYVRNTQVELIALPEKGSSFQGWNGSCLGKNNCILTMYDDKNIRATFAVSNPQIFIVNTLEDSGLGSFRQAIVDANENAGDDIITFSKELNGTITLTSGQLEVTDSLIIEGLGANILAISGNNNSRILKINPGVIGAVTISGLTLMEGKDTSGNGGGAIIVESGTITINDSALINNVANLGGGGGGLRKFGSGVVTIVNTLIAGNNALDEFEQGDGGGIRSDQENLILINSTISGNIAGSGGGITSNNGVLEIYNSTITNNSALSPGGGINSSSEIRLGNSIISGNIAPQEKEISFFSVDGLLFISRGHNIVGENGISGITPDLSLDSTDLIFETATNTLLKPLANNGGSTFSHLPVRDGKAIDSGDNSLIPQGVINDQRGSKYSRIENESVDIGAIELKSSTQVPVSVLMLLLL